MPTKPCRRCGAPTRYEKDADAVACERCQRGARIIEEIQRDEDEDREDES